MTAALAMRPRRQGLGLAVSLAASFAAGALGGRASADAAGFYGSLVQPAWAPPAWLFGPVWTLLFVLMSVSAWRVWRVGGFAPARAALGLHGVQLVANAAWTWLFFVWQRGAWALAEIALLWALIAVQILVFRRHDRLAAWLLLPYLGWVSFAAALNFALWRLNPGLLG